MTPHRTLIIVAISSFVAGGVLIGTVAAVLFNRILNEQFRGNFISSFYANAAEAQSDVRSLANLRSGNVDPAIAELDLKLNAHTIYLGAYENSVPPAKRVAYVYRVLAEVRAYRDKFPARFDYPAQEAAYRRALALGKKTAGN